MSVTLDTDSNTYIFMCPHCDHTIQVDQNQVNCRIFRHAYFFRQTPTGIELLNQLPPHAPQQECDRVVREKLVIGCAKPFIMQPDNGGYRIEKCGYI